MSTEEQAQGGHSLEVQERVIKKKAEEHELSVVDVVRDEGYTATNAERPGLRRIMKAVVAGEVDVVMASEQDRLFRNEDDRREHERLSLLAGVRFAFADEPWEEKAHLRKFTRGLKGVLAELYSDRLGDKVGGVMRDMASRGLWTGGPCPYGYQVVVVNRVGSRVDRKLAEDPETAAVIRMIFDRYVEKRIGCHTIANGLNDLAIPSPAAWAKAVRLSNGADREASFPRGPRARYSPCTSGTGLPSKGGA